MTTIAPVVDVHLAPHDLSRLLERDVAEGLTASPKELPPKWFYDAHGSALFDRITRLDEYYPTEAEREILQREAGAIAALTDADTVIELGSGTSDKTRTLLDAFWRTSRLERFVPFDVSEATLRDAADQLAGRYPGLLVHGVVGDFDHHLVELPRGGRHLVALLGGTIGNYPPAARSRFLADLAAGMARGDHLLLGTDLVKDADRLVRAYDDAEGVTADFNKNVLSVINRALDADFTLDNFDHVAHWDPVHEWIEMRLRSRCDQRVRVDALELEVEFGAGEIMRTEISAKFRPERVQTELEAAGLKLVEWWTDTAGDFGVALAVRV